ncbi:ATP-dependent metallopeptidase FtsH/Yme1/Tma family protein, partial [uncultured Intestinimonas sp.]|uniref:ATP-dependent metallopeptidase FtsH/Yme1/Tma family protein n=1 Tax=uncultured Intestinimonas sp. TaxID=1689265 RepID=UPI0025F9DE36
MNEVKTPKKPLIYYYSIALLILLLFNFLAMPWLAQRQIREVDYNTFVTMLEDGQVGLVQLQEQENRVLFTDREETTVYKTTLVGDPDLTERVLSSGASLTGEEIEQASPLLSFLLTWVLPILIFVAIGQYMSRRMMKNAGGPNAMMFGKSNAKVYVKSSEGIKFSDVAGEDEAKDNLKEIVEYLHDPKKYQEIGASMPKGILLVGPPGTGKTMLAKA